MEELIATRDDPREALEAVFVGVGTLATSPACLGFAFVGASVEYPALDHRGHRVALDHKDWVLGRLRGLAESAGVRDPGGLSEELLLPMDGAWSAARVYGPGNHARRVAEAARELIDARLDHAGRGAARQH